MSNYDGRKPEPPYPTPGELAAIAAEAETLKALAREQNDAAALRTALSQAHAREKGYKKALGDAVGLHITKRVKEARERGEERVPAFFSCDWVEEVERLLASPATEGEVRHSRTLAKGHVERARRWYGDNVETLGNDLDTDIQSIAAQFAAVEQEATSKERERCAGIAKAHKGSAARKRRLRGDIGDDHIYAEERGEDIAAEMIEAAIRATGEKE